VRSSLYYFFFHARAFIPLSGVHKNKTVPIIYIEPNGEEKEVQAEIGKNLLDIAHENNIELEGTQAVLIHACRVFVRTI
jgi:hypothetical protein